MNVFVNFGKCGRIGYSDDSAHRIESETSFLNVSHIADVCDVEGTQRLREEITKEEYDGRVQSQQSRRDYVKENDRYFRHSDTAEILLSMFAAAANNHRANTYSYSVLVRGTAADIVAQIEKASRDAAVAQAKAIADAVDPAPRLNDLGEWEAEVTYAMLDVVSVPGDPSQRYLAIAENTSSSKAILTNKSFWCRFPAAE